MVDFQIPITYVVSAEAVIPQQSLSPLKLSTIVIFTDEEPATAIIGNYFITRTSQTAIQQWGSNTETAQQVQMIFSQSPNILANNGYVIIAPFTSTEETLSEAITRLSSEIYFEGILTTRDVTDEEATAVSTLVQSLKNKVYALPQSNVSALSGIFNTVKNNFYTKCLLYTLGADSAEQAKNSRLFAAAYLSKAMSVNYSGSNTTMTMNLKDLVGIAADTNISQSIIEQCKTIGCDCFPSIEGLAKVMSFAQGGYYMDQVLNSIWFVTTLQREYFNALATVRTKIAQTDSDLEKISKAVNAVCRQAVINGYLAPGIWAETDDTFGVYEDFIRNISEFGYYYYHQPVTMQTQTDREERKAPVYQVAGKEAGAVHSGSVLVYFQA